MLVPTVGLLWCDKINMYTLEIVLGSSVYLSSHCLVVINSTQFNCFMAELTYDLFSSRARSDSGAG